jgi:hypothetical protein
MPGQTGSLLQKQVDAAELALRHIARLHSHQGQQLPQRIAQQTLHKMTMLASQGQTSRFDARATSPPERGRISAQLD